MVTALSSTDQAQNGNPFRVMVVDDSAIIRGFLSRYLSEDPQIEVVTTANTGAVALRQLERYDIEVVVLDIEMPEMDGMTALPLMMEKYPDLQVVMASTLTRKNADISLRALQMGAVDYVPKPETARSVNASIDFRRELVDKVKAWAVRRRNKRQEPLPEMEKPETGDGAGSSRLQAGFVSSRRSGRGTTATTSVRAQVPEVGSEDRFVPRALGKKKIELRQDAGRGVKILAIGSSTGGPQALMRFFKGFDRAPSVPVVITQHMPPTFTAILAEHLGQATGWPCCEARTGQPLEAGHIYVAPGGKHLEIVKGDAGYLAHLSDAAPENFCKPAVDPMIRSLVEVYHDRVLAVILTGMGHDGLKGARELVRVGGTVFAQDEASSVVWGMPGAVATAGLCASVLPLDELGKIASQRLMRGV